MNQAMKISLIGLAFFISGSAQAFQFPLKNYEAVETAVADGYGLRVVVDMKHCQSENPVTVDALASLVADSLMVVKNKSVSFSNLHFTANNPQYKDTPVYESTKFNLTTDKQLKIIHRTYQAVTYQLLRERELICELGTSAKFYKKR